MQARASVQECQSEAKDESVGDMPNLVVIYGPDRDDRVDRQLELLSHATSQARQRDVGYLEVRRMPQEELFRQMADIAPDEFAVLLVRDGEAVARWDEPTDPAAVWAAFDA
jgi:hypothetical protein